MKMADFVTSFYIKKNIYICNIFLYLLLYIFLFYFINIFTIYFNYEIKLYFNGFI